MTDHTDNDVTRLASANSAATAEPLEEWDCECGTGWQLTASEAAKGCPCDYPDHCGLPLVRRSDWTVSALERWEAMHRREWARANAAEARADAAERRLRTRDIVCVPDEQVETVRGYAVGADPCGVTVINVEALRAGTVREFFGWLADRDTFNLPTSDVLERWLRAWLRGDL
jgi:hypothetical protein